jgi:hypothetical protein
LLPQLRLKRLPSPQFRLSPWLPPLLLSQLRPWLPVPRMLMLPPCLSPLLLRALTLLQLRMAARTSAPMPVRTPALTLIPFSPASPHVPANRRAAW